MIFLDKFKDILFDSHAHLSSPEYEKEIDSIIERSKSNAVEVIFDIGVNMESSKQSIELSKKFPETIYSFIGIDPEAFIHGSPFFVGFDKKDDWFEDTYEQLYELIAKNSQLIVGIGETGMDYYHNREQNNDYKEQSNRLQEQLFRIHLELAKKTKLPLSIHSRFAEKECLQIVKEYDVRGNFHSYTGDYETAKNILDSGWGLGVNGIITFKNANELKEVYKKILGKLPLRLSDTSPIVGEERGELLKFLYNKGIYFETDSPFLSPDGKRGERNEPGNIALIFDTFCKMLK